MRSPAGTLLLAALLLVGCAGPRGLSDVEPSDPPATTATAAATTPDPGDPATRAPDTPALQYPDPQITPGNTLTVEAADVCTAGWAGAHRKDLTIREQRDVLAAYALPLTTVVAEWDHLISLELGGGNGVLNVWPQLDHDQDQRKDRLENRLHLQVCRDQLGLVEAQGRIREFWRWW